MGQGLEKVFSFVYHRVTEDLKTKNEIDSYFFACMELFR